jgi:hypothetical protein
LWTQACLHYFLACICTTLKLQVVTHQHYCVH